ncbi:MAG: DinB family protein [Oligoflexus sp.]|nr:DinB family protein [Pseudopedobacter sp.]
MLATLLSKEFEEEMATSIKMLAIVPADKFDWQPHPKSMSLGKLANHIAEIHGWPKFCLDFEDVDFGLNPWDAPKSDSADGLVKISKTIGQESLNTIKAADDDTFLNKKWKMKHHGHIILDFTKYEAVRHSLGQMIHHRAQLGVFLRLLEIKIPGSYGPSADEME